MRICSFWWYTGASLVKYVEIYLVILSENITKTFDIEARGPGVNSVAMDAHIINKYSMKRHCFKKCKRLNYIHTLIEINIVLVKQTLLYQTGQYFIEIDIFH